MVKKPKRYILLLSTAIVAVILAEPKYVWPQFTNLYDCVAGITVDDKPIASGVYVHFRHIWTAANPLEQYVGERSRISVYVVHLKYNVSKKLELDNIHGNTLYRKSRWGLRVGFDGLHYTLHDIICVVMKYVDNMRPWTVKYPYEMRLPFVQRTPPMTYGSSWLKFTEVPGGPLNSTGWSIAGFGFIDKQHVKENVQMEVVDYLEEHVLVDCDEWIPREWGNFICLLNVDNFVGIAAGAGLFYNQVLMGLGSFALEKGNESILLFTDLRVYRRKAVYCKPEKSGILYFDEYYGPTSRKPVTSTTQTTTTRPSIVYPTKKN